jgi:hypothetical protein
LTDVRDLRMQTKVQTTKDKESAKTIAANKQAWLTSNQKARAEVDKAQTKAKRSRPILK